eukprot:8025294-Prorocentrum_lima.AAC.1
MARPDGHAFAVEGGPAGHSTAVRYQSLAVGADAPAMQGTRWPQSPGGGLPCGSRSGGNDHHNQRIR